MQLWSLKSEEDFTRLRKELQSAVEPGTAGVKFESCLLAELPLAGEWEAFIQLDQATYPLEDNLSYLKTTSLNANLIQTHPHRSMQKNIWPNIWAVWLSHFDTET